MMEVATGSAPVMSCMLGGFNPYDRDTIHYTTKDIVLLKVIALNNLTISHK